MIMLLYAFNLFVFFLDYLAEIRIFLRLWCNECVIFLFTGMYRMNCVEG